MCSVPAVRVLPAMCDVLVLSSALTFVCSPGLNDTGACDDCVSLAFAQSLGVPIRPSKSPDLGSASGNALGCNKWCDLFVYFPKFDFYFRRTFLVCSRLNIPIIVGRRTLNFFNTLVSSRIDSRVRECLDSARSTDRDNACCTIPCVSDCVCGPPTSRAPIPESVSDDSVRGCGRCVKLQGKLKRQANFIAQHHVPRVQATPQSPVVGAPPPPGRSLTPPSLTTPSLLPPPPAAVQTSEDALGPARPPKAHQPIDKVRGAPNTTQSGAPADTYHVTGEAPVGYTPQLVAPLHSPLTPHSALVAPVSAGLALHGPLSLDQLLAVAHGLPHRSRRAMVVLLKSWGWGWTVWRRR